MSLKYEFRTMVKDLISKFPIPEISETFFPPFYRGGQPRDSEFMALALEGGAVGVSYVLLPDEKMDEYNALQSSDFAGMAPEDFAIEFGHDEPIKNMISLAALNAVCQHVIKQSNYPLDFATNSLGLLCVSQGDKIGMVGLFPSLVKMIENAGAELIVVEKKEQLVEKFPELNITLDPAELKPCNKVICTSTTILNNTLEEILTNCAPRARVSIIGPTAGYFPDPLFSRGVDVVGGTLIKDGELFLRLIAAKERWGSATQKFCFQKESYMGIP